MPRAELHVTCRGSMRIDREHPHARLALTNTLRCSQRFQTNSAVDVLTPLQSAHFVVRCVELRPTVPSTAERSEIDLAKHRLSGFWQRLD